MKSPNAGRQYFYKLIGQTPVPCGDDPLEWAEHFEIDERRVRVTIVGCYEVSTVFLGLDHNWGSGPPLLFETMVFLHATGERFPTGTLPPDLDYQARCSTWLQAEAQHERAIEGIRAPWDEITQLWPVPRDQTPFDEVQVE